MHILLLNDNSHINSFGCQASVAALRAMLAERFPGAQIRGVLQDDLTQKQRFLVRLRTSMGFESQDFPAVANEFPEYGERWRGGQAGVAGKDFLGLLHWADLVVHNAELLNYTYNRISCRCAFLTWFAKMHLGKVAMMINQTAPAPGSDLMMDGILEFVCPHLDLVTAREPRSHEALARLGIEAVLVPDPVFSMEPDFSKSGDVEAWKHSVGLTSPYLCLSFTSVLNLAHRQRSLDPLIQTIRGLAETGLQVVLIHGGDAGKVARALSQQTGTTLFRGDLVRFWSLLKGAMILVSGHYHNMIMAAMVGCPFTAFRSVSHKVEGLCDLLKWPLKPLNPTCLVNKTEHVRSNLEWILRDRSRLSEQLLTTTCELRSWSQMTGQLVRDRWVRSGGEGSR